MAARSVPELENLGVSKPCGLGTGSPEPIRKNIRQPEVCHSGHSDHLFTGLISLSDHLVGVFQGFKVVVAWLRCF